MLTHKSQLFNNSHQCNVQKKRIKFKTSDAYFICCLIPIYDVRSYCIGNCFVFQVNLWEPFLFSVRTTALTHRHRPHEKHAHAHIKNRTLTHTFSTASREGSQWSFYTNLLAIWAVGFKKYIKTNKNINTNKKKKHTSSIVTNVRVAMTFEMQQANFSKPNFPFLWHPAIAVRLIFSEVFIVQQYWVLLSSSNYSKALAPAVTPCEHWGRTRLGILCNKTPCFISHAIQFHFFVWVKQIENKDTDWESDGDVGWA